MVKLWARTVSNQKTVKKYDYVRYDDMEWAKFFDYVRDICHAMDISTPVITKTHLFNFAKFHFVKFLKSDFIEDVNFDYLMIENVGHSAPRH